VEKAFPFLEKLRGKATAIPGGARLEAFPL
jgi:hypothetical protein